jgi:hypothetical protein
MLSKFHLDLMAHHKWHTLTVTESGGKLRAPFLSESERQKRSDEMDEKLKLPDCYTTGLI